MHIEHNGDMEEKGNLILTRHPGESVMIGDDIEVTILKNNGLQVHLSFRVPKSVEVYRKEIWYKIQEEKGDE